MASRETAARLGGVPRNAPAPRAWTDQWCACSNTYIANGDWKLEEIFEELGDGVYLCGSRGGQVSTPVQCPREAIWWKRARRPGFCGTCPCPARLLRPCCMSGRWATPSSSTAGALGRARTARARERRIAAPPGDRGDGGRSRIRFSKTFQCEG
jgi:hypothetical protein